jgi:hypothetical protein
MRQLQSGNAVKGGQGIIGENEVERFVLQRAQELVALSTRAIVHDSRPRLVALR